MVDVAYHKPVLVDEVIEGLSIKPDGIYVDGTLGGGGHFSRMVDRLDSRGIAFGIDRDGDALTWVNEHLATGEIVHRCRVILERGEFSMIGALLQKHSIGEVNGMLLDLGVSSHQFDSPERGFTYRADAPLDMRMNRDSRVTAADIISNGSEEELERILGEYGEIRNPARMAGVIVRYAQKKGMKTSGDLCGCLELEYKKQLPNKILSKIFQALRIAVNDELRELQHCLANAVTLLAPEGRLVVIAYHSLEDRIVKNFIRDHEGRGDRGSVCQKLKRVTKKAVQCSTTEVDLNRRSRSARLRIAEKIT